VKTYKATVRLHGIGFTEVRVQAANPIFARGMLEAQYGKANVIGYPLEVK
jgi:hypothetical protein